MPPLQKIEAGSRFWKLVTLDKPFRRKPKDSKYFYTFVKCKCDCGSVGEFMILHLKNGHTKSCGCERIEIMTKMNLVHGDTVKGKNVRLHRVWTMMKCRCNNEKSTSYHLYGGRGIRVCKEWNDSYVQFRKWALENGYDDSLELDRRDNNKGYFPENCRFVTVKANLRNTRRNVVITAFGETKVLVDWCSDPRCKVAFNTVRKRMREGWTAEDAITKPAYYLRWKT